MTFIDSAFLVLFDILTIPIIISYLLGKYSEIKSKTYIESMHRGTVLKILCSISTNSISFLTKTKPGPKESMQALPPMGQ